MDHLTQKTFTTSRSLTYTYYHSAPSTDPKSTLPTLLFQHGWPDSAQLWKTLSASLADLPFPILIPDLLGYGGTSKPTDPALYNTRAMTDDLVELLDAESIGRVISIGHDWGSFLAQRLYLFHPARVAGLVLLNVAYLPPTPDGPPFDLDATLAYTEQKIGYPAYAYWQLFTAPDGPRVLRDHLASLWTVLHGAKPGWMKDMFCVRGAMRAFLLADTTVPVKPYAQDPAAKEAFVARMQRDGFEGPQCWYRAMKDNHHYAVEREIPAERLKVDVPMLYIGFDDDAVCLPAMIRIPQAQGLLPDLTVGELEGGHWGMLERPKEVEGLFRDWLKKF